MGWVLIGFVAAAHLPGAGGCTVAELVATCCGFTCWSFLGLLILPTVSRQAAYTIDRQVLELGLSQEALGDVMLVLNTLQAEESERPAWIEAIFHPVPCSENRKQARRGSPGAWHAARMMLFLSWSCLGLLSRAVHCNAGRPELWVLLPTD